MVWTDEKKPVSKTATPKNSFFQVVTLVDFMFGFGFGFALRSQEC
jgi:hypothetical protein